MFLKALHNNMFYIASTRFNNETYNENICYRGKSCIPVIYGTSIRIQEKYDIGTLLFVAEMNNEENRIEGIGLIRNTQVYDKKHTIYSNSDYNRYLYKGDCWISRETILDKDDEIKDEDMDDEKEDDSDDDVDDYDKPDANDDDDKD